jgi:hypothetical protein
VASHGPHDDFDEKATFAVPAEGDPESIADAGSLPPLRAERYGICSLVGRGGKGAGYRALDTELDEVIALEVSSAVDTGLCDRRGMDHRPLLESLRSDGRFLSACELVAERARRVRDALRL